MNFTTGKIIAIEVGTKNIRIIEAKSSKDSVEIIQARTMETTDGAYWDGNINDVRPIVEAVKLVLGKKNPKSYKMVLVMGSNNIIVRDMTVPKGTDEEVENLVYYEAQQFLPANNVEYEIHSKIVEEVQESDGVYFKVMLAAVPKDIAESYMRIPSILGMETEAIDLNSNCVWKYLYGTKWLGKNKKKELESQDMVVDFGHRITSVYFFSNGNLTFSRFLVKGSSQIDEAIAEAQGIGIFDAEKLKIEKGYLTSGDVFEESEEANNEITVIIRPNVIQLLTEINRLMEFYITKNNVKKIDRIYITGGGSQISGMDKFMGIYFGMPVEALSTELKVNYSGRGKKEDFYNTMHLYANVIGSVVRDE